MGRCVYMGCFLGSRMPRWAVCRIHRAADAQVGTWRVWVMEAVMGAGPHPHGSRQAHPEAHLVLLGHCW